VSKCLGSKPSAQTFLDQGSNGLQGTTYMTPVKPHFSKYLDDTLLDLHYQYLQRSNLGLLVSSLERWQDSRNLFDIYLYLQVNLIQPHRKYLRYTLEQLVD
jgi:hypothetical protein